MAGLQNNKYIRDTRHRSLDFVCLVLLGTFTGPGFLVVSCLGSEIQASVQDFRPIN